MTRSGDQTGEGATDGDADPAADVAESTSGRASLVRRARPAGETIAAVYRLVEETQISLLAAAIAYFAFVSMVPMVVLAVVVATTLGGDALAEQVVVRAGAVLTPAGEGLLRDAVTARTGLGSVTVVGLVVLLWGALKAFRAMDRAFSEVYGTRSPESIVEAIRDASLALSAVGAGVAAMVVIGAAVALLPGRIPGSLGVLALVVTLFVVFLPLYVMFPGADLTVGEVLPGAALAAVGWTVLGSAFGLYATSFTGTSVYGLLGGVLLALTWLYLGALLLLLGAALNAVRSGHAAAPDQ